MNLLKEVTISVGGPGGCGDYHRQAKMLKYLLEDAGVKNVIIQDDHRDLHKERHDDELKLFAGAKFDKVIIKVEHWPWGG